MRDRSQTAGLYRVNFEGGEGAINRCGRFRRSAGAIWLCLALAAAAFHPRPAAADQACKPTIEREIPVEFDGNRLLTWGVIDGARARMQIATGSETTLLDYRAAIALHLRPDGKTLKPAITPDGAKFSRDAFVRSISVGGYPWNQRSLAIGYTANDTKEDYPVVVRLGTDWLKGADIEIDPICSRLIFWDVSDCSGDFVPWRESHIVVPLRSIPRGLMIVPVEIGGKKFDALLATGTSISFMTSDAAVRAGMPKDIASAGLPDPIITRGGENVPLRSFGFPDVRIGPEKIPLFQASVGKLGNHTVDMFLGFDYLKGRHVWISYATKQLFLGPRPSADTVSAPAKPQQLPKTPK